MIVDNTYTLLLKIKIVYENQSSHHKRYFFLYEDQMFLFHTTKYFYVAMHISVSAPKHFQMYRGFVTIKYDQYCLHL